MTGAKNSGKGARMKQFMRPIVAVILLTGLAGCSSSPAETAPMHCPDVAMLQQAQSLTTFQPGRSDVAAQVTTAQITGVAGSCQLQPKKRLLLVKFQAGFLASNGPANHGSPLTLPYFVAITDGDNIISKTNYTIVLKFNGNASTAQATSKPVKVELSNDRRSGHVQILVGFQLTPEQISYAQSHPIQAP
jgi:hypothetical protein